MRTRISVSYMENSSNSLFTLLLHHVMVPEVAVEEEGPHQVREGGVHQAEDLGLRDTGHQENPHLLDHQAVGKSSNDRQKVRFRFVSIS